MNAKIHRDTPSHFGENIETIEEIVQLFESQLYTCVVTPQKPTEDGH